EEGCLTFATAQASSATLEGDTALAIIVMSDRHHLEIVVVIVAIIQHRRSAFILGILNGRHQLLLRLFNLFLELVVEKRVSGALSLLSLIQKRPESGVSWITNLSKHISIAANRTMQNSTEILYRILRFLHTLPQSI